MKLIYLISRVFLAWAFNNFSLHCELWHSGSENLKKVQANKYSCWNQINQFHNSYFLYRNFDRKSCFVVFFHELQLEWNECKNPQFNFSSQNLNFSDFWAITTFSRFRILGPSLLSQFSRRIFGSLGHASLTAFWKFANVHIILTKFFLFILNFLKFGFTKKKSINGNYDFKRALVLMNIKIF